MIGKVVCVSKPHKVWNITPGKIYDLYYNKYTLQYKNNDICIIDDKGDEFLFVEGLELYSDYFITLEEWRDRKLNEIGIV